MRVPLYSVIIAGVNDATATNGAASGSRAANHDVTQTGGVPSMIGPDVVEELFQTPSRLTLTLGAFTLAGTIGGWTYNVTALGIGIYLEGRRAR